MFHQVLGQASMLTFLAMTLHIVDHPLLHDIMARLRDRKTSSEDYRALTYRISTFLVAEATRNLPTREIEVETPLETTSVRRLDSRVVAVPVLRAGIGMLQAFVDLVPGTQVGYFGLQRDEETAQARCYYEKVPADLGEAVVCLLDPMLATGGSAAMAIEGLVARGARDVRLVVIVAAPEGVELVSQRAPGTEIYTAALDRGLNGRKYIVPGLGDFGDRLYGT